MVNRFKSGERAVIYWELNTLVFAAQDSTGDPEKRSAGAGSLRAVGQNGRRHKGLAGHCLHAQLALLADPNDAEMGGLAAHANVKHFARPHATAQALDDDAAGAHVGNQCRLHEGLA